MRTVVCFIDGFNLYHAIDNINGVAETKVSLDKNTISCIDLFSKEQPFKEQISYANGNLRLSYITRENISKLLSATLVSEKDKESIRKLYKKSCNLNYLKWLDLDRLMNFFIDIRTQKIDAIYYFSAYAEWRKEASKKHKEYVKALVQKGITPVMGKFKTKDKKCQKCGHQWKGHEEKETDVNIALHIVKMAFYKQYDEAFIVTQDSDIAPALKMAKNINPSVRLKVITPPNVNTSRELARIADKFSSINIAHLNSSLLPREIKNSKGEVIAVRPEDYSPPEKS